MAAEDYCIFPNTKAENKDEGKRKSKNKKLTSQTQKIIELVWGMFPFKLVWYIGDTYFPFLMTPAYLSFKMLSFQVLLFMCFVSFT